MLQTKSFTRVGSAPLVRNWDGQRGTEVRLSEVIAGLSTALDLTEGQRPGHSVRSCAIGMRLTEVLGLSKELRSALFYALLMKDLGCSSNASHFATLFAADDQTLKTRLSLVDWSRALESFRFVAESVAPGLSWNRRVWQALAVFSKGPKGARDVVLTRCERGAEIAQVIGFAKETVHAIRALGEIKMDFLATCREATAYLLRPTPSISFVVISNMAAPFAVDHVAHAHRLVNKCFLF